jgi:lipoprotein NlpI
MTRALPLVLLAMVLASSGGCADNAKAARDHSALGTVLRSNGDYDQAIAQYDEAIALMPNDAGFHNNRGIAYDLKGDYAHAIKDFDDALRQDPSHEAALKNRSRAYFFAGDFAKSAEDMHRALSFDTARANARPNRLFDRPGAFSLIVYHLAMLRQGQPDSVEFGALASRVDPAKWPAPVIRFMTGRITAAALLAAAAASGEKDTPDQSCAADFYIGEVSLSAHHADEAKQHFKGTIARCSQRASEYRGATAEMARLKP